MVRLISLFATVVLVASLVFSAQAAIIHVPADQLTIQAGIDAAIQGDTVLVADGTYTGDGNRDIDFGGKNIVLKSENGAEFTIIDVEGSPEPHRGFNFHSGEDSSAVLDGFTIENGFGGFGFYGTGISCSNSSPTIINNIIRENSNRFGRGGGISCRLNSNPLISNNIITRNSTRTTYGGGIYCSESSPTITNNIIFFNAARNGFGGGIFCGDNSNPLISNNSISENEGNYGGGISCFNSSPTIINNTLNGNVTRLTDGGGIYCSDSNPIISDNTISGNSASYGGGIYCISSSPIISRNSITANLGGGIYIGNSSPEISNTIIWFNTGPQVVTTGSSMPSITYCAIQDGWEGEGNIDDDPLLVGPLNANVCSQSPCIDAGDPSLLDPDASRSDIGLFFPDHPVCSFGIIWYVSTGGSNETGDGSQGNPFKTIQHAVDQSRSGDTVIVANGSYVENVSIVGKNILLTSNYLYSEDSLDIKNTVIDGDSASTVVTLLYCDSLSTVNGFTISNGGRDTRGEGIYCFASNTTISYNTISGNLGLHSGGISCLSNSNPKIINNSIYGNVSKTGGGGISCSDSNPTINDNKISGNSTWNRSGGGIQCYKSNPTISNNIISGNTAGISAGGGIACFNSNPMISNNIIINNLAGRIILSRRSGGGGIYCDESSPTISNNTISGNSSESGGGLCLINNSNPTLQKNIIAYNNLGEAILCVTSSEIVVNCCNIFGNEGGDWVGCVSDQAGINGNISTDPLFCDTAANDFHLDAFSPCLPSSPFNACAVLIGALDVGCDFGFVCGDANGDSQVTQDDIDYLIAFYFAFGPAPYPLTVADLNIDGVVDLSDIMFLAEYLNGIGPAPCAGSEPPPSLDPKKKPEGIGVSTE